jgi:AcrR family transcriptional regulator
MPTTSRITEDMILDAGIALLRRAGEQAVSVRSVAAELHCSTQPVMYHFRSVGALKDALYSRADALHTAYLSEPDDTGDPLLAVGLRYIRFGAEERHLFRFLFQSDRLGGRGLRALTTDPALAPVIALAAQEAQLPPEQAAEAFGALALAVHGYASLLANNSMPFDAADAAHTLQLIFFGVIGALQTGGTQHEEAL